MDFAAEKHYNGLNQTKPNELFFDTVGPFWEANHYRDKPLQKGNWTMRNN